MSTSPSAISFPYKPKKLIMIICFAFFGLGAWILAYMALTNERGVNLVFLRHILEISFSPFEAILFFWVLAGCSGIMSLLGIFGFFRAFTARSQVVITDDAIIVPLGVFNKNKTKTVPFKEIHSLELQKVHGQRILKIIHDKGKAQLSDCMLPNKATIDEIETILINRIGMNQ